MLFLNEIAGVQSAAFLKRAVFSEIVMTVTCGLLLPTTIQVV